MHFVLNRRNNRNGEVGYNFTNVVEILLIVIETQIGIQGRYFIQDPYGVCQLKEMFLRIKIKPSENTFLFQTEIFIIISDFMDGLETRHTKTFS